MGLEVNDVHDCHMKLSADDSRMHICDADCCPLRANLPTNWVKATVGAVCPKTHLVKEN